MELKNRQSDVTETSKRALASNRGQSETLKSTYDTLQSEYKSKRSNLNAEQARFVRLMKTKLPAIKVSRDERAETVRPLFLTPPDSPLVERQKLPSLQTRRRSKSFSDLSQAFGLHEQGTPDRFLRQRSCEHIANEQETLTENRTNFISARPRSLSAIDPPLAKIHTKNRVDSDEETLFDLGGRKHVGTHSSCVEATRKHSSPARLFPIDADRVHETRKLTSRKPFGKQLEDVKDLRYLRTGKYSTNQELVAESKLSKSDIS